MGKIALLVAALGAGMIWLVVLRLKGVAAPLLMVYGLLLLSLVVGLLWPKVLGMRRRARALRLIGMPAGLCTLGLYSVAVFYISDVPVILGVAAVSLLVAIVVRRDRRTPDGRSRRVFLLGGAALALGVAGVVSAEWVGRYRHDRQAEGTEARRRALQAPGARRRIEDDRVRVFPLRTGETVVTYGQFYGGLDGWEGVTGYLRTLTDKTLITVPVYAYLIDHPRHGLLMIDAGVNWEQAHDHDGYYNHNAMVSRLLSERDEYTVTPEQDLRVQIARLGYDVEDVKTVFLTHVHDDHAGGLRSLPQATVVLDRRDWDDGVRYSYSFGLVEDDLAFPRFDSGPYGEFPESQDYFGDGSVILLPTPGHSPGHLCVLLRMDEGSALFMGDTLYTLPHLAVDEVRQMTIGGADTTRQLDAARWIQGLLTSSPATVPLFAHDNTRYQREVESVFRGGRPGATGVAALRRHLSSVLTSDWRLRPGHAPHFVPSDARTGEVEFR